jgi:hypothetical protein
MIQVYYGESEVARVRENTGCFDVGRVHQALEACSGDVDTAVEWLIEAMATDPNSCDPATAPASSEHAIEASTHASTPRSAASVDDAMASAEGIASHRHWPSSGDEPLEDKGKGTSTCSYRVAEKAESDTLAGTDVLDERESCRARIAMKCGHTSALVKGLTMCKKKDRSRFCNVSSTSADNSPEPVIATCSEKLQLHASLKSSSSTFSTPEIVNDSATRAVGRTLSSGSHALSHSSAERSTAEQVPNIQQSNSINAIPSPYPTAIALQSNKGCTSNGMISCPQQKIPFLKHTLNQNSAASPLHHKREWRLCASCAGADDSALGSKQRPAVCEGPAGVIDACHGCAPEIYGVQHVVCCGSSNKASVCDSCGAAIACRRGKNVAISSKHCEAASCDDVSTSNAHQCSAEKNAGDSVLPIHARCNSKSVTGGCDARSDVVAEELSSKVPEGAGYHANGRQKGTSIVHGAQDDQFEIPVANGTGTQAAHQDFQPESLLVYGKTDQLRRVTPCGAAREHANMSKVAQRESLEDGLTPDNDSGVCARVCSTGDCQTCSGRRAQAELSSSQEVLLHVDSSRVLTSAHRNVEGSTGEQEAKQVDACAQVVAASSDSWRQCSRTQGMDMYEVAAGTAHSSICSTSYTADMTTQGARKDGAGLKKDADNHINMVGSSVSDTTTAELGLLEECLHSSRPPDQAFWKIAGGLDRNAPDLAVCNDQQRENVKGRQLECAADSEVQEDLVGEGKRETEGHGPAPMQGEALATKYAPTSVEVAMVRKGVHHAAAGDLTALGKGKAARHGQGRDPVLESTESASETPKSIKLAEADLGKKGAGGGGNGKLAKGVAARKLSAAVKRPANNKPCPCGSGRKYKQCCKLLEDQRLRKQGDRARARKASALRSTAGLAALHLQVLDI